MDKNLVYKLLLILFICLLALMYMKKNNIIISSTTLNDNKCPCENFEEVKEEEEIIENFDNNLFGGSATVQCSQNYTESTFPATGCYLENLKDPKTKTEITDWDIYDFLNTDFGFFDSSTGQKYKTTIPTAYTSISSTNNYSPDPLNSTDKGLKFIIGLIKLYYVGMSIGINLYYTTSTSAADKTTLITDFKTIKSNMMKTMDYLSFDDDKSSIKAIKIPGNDKEFITLKLKTQGLINLLTSSNEYKIIIDLGLKNGTANLFTIKKI